MLKAPMGLERAPPSAALGPGGVVEVQGHGAGGGHGWRVIAQVQVAKDAARGVGALTRVSPFSLRLT